MWDAVWDGRDVNEEIRALPHSPPCVIHPTQPPFVSLSFLTLTSHSRLPPLSRSLQAIPQIAQSLPLRPATTC
ncbi:hypothetical protein E2C01_046123 [Portunus trituberculatus]|uniref:Uncharacterized protein n=1 Tax=Portunus trituberculatus TaxID=210409 RepID=A0A5B7FWZ8_PORTR|nr:hypothetical protein [Portunus trituberculatus]